MRLISYDFHANSKWKCLRALSTIQCKFELCNYTTRVAAVQAGHGVITSYSIHYTKLYEYCKSIKFLWASHLAFSGSLLSYSDTMAVSCPSTNRITSYNVCYTKLLRFSLSYSQTLIPSHRLNAQRISAVNGRSS